MVPMAPMASIAARLTKQSDAVGYRRRCPSAHLALHALIVLGVASWTLAAETEDILVAYRSRLGTLPAAQGWQHVGMTLSTGCPANPGACRWQGAIQNSCRSGEGCRLPGSGPPAGEHYNAPAASSTGDYSFTEWIAFDDGDDHFELAYPSTTLRNLTIADSLWGPHVNPGFGAPWFANAPSNHLCLRLVTGGGVPRVPTLPYKEGGKRNTGQACLKAGFAAGPPISAVTLVARMAAGNREGYASLVQLKALGRAVSVGVDGIYNATTLGEFAWGQTARSDRRLFAGRRVTVACCRPGVAGPQAGEFFTLRLVLRADGTFTAWLNEDPASACSGSGGTTSETAVLVNPSPMAEAGVMWVDEIEVRAGEVPPGPCPDPVFDVDRNGEVEAADLTGQGGFAGCATGPAWAGVWADLPRACQCLDVNDDQSVDMIDYAAFQRCWSAQTPLPDVNVACDD